VVVVARSLHSFIVSNGRHNRTRVEKNMVALQDHLKPKDCIGTLLAFESQVQTPADIALPTPALSANPAILLRTPCGAGARENFRRIKKTLVPQRCIRQRTRLPLLKSRKSGCNHATVRRVKYHNNSCQFLSLLR
jgi:hypothetical protein